MKILLLHNYYQYKGGEDTVFKLEQDMLLRNGAEVKVLSFDNKTIISFNDKIKAGINSIYNKKSAEKLETDILNFKPDVIHVHNFFPIASPSILFVAKKHNIPIIMTLHNYRLICAGALLFRDAKICEDCVNKTIPLAGIVHACYRNSRLESTAVTLMSSIHKIMGTWRDKVDMYIALSEFARKKYLQSSLKISHNQIVVKPNFVEDPGDETHERGDYFIFVGRFAEEKRIETIIDSLKYYKYKIKFIGDGPYRKVVEAAASKNIGIEYLGFQNRDFIIEQLKRAKALLFPSVWYEGMPMTIIEAFSTGTPVIASDIGILSSLITNGINGLHFKPGDSIHLAEKIKFFETNPQKMQSLYSNARQTYIDHYTPKRNYNLMMEIYNNVITQKKLEIKSSEKSNYN